MKELTIPATVENIEKVTEFVNSQLEEINCPINAKMQIDIAIDELFGNIAHYAYKREYKSGAFSAHKSASRTFAGAYKFALRNGSAYDGRFSCDEGRVYRRYDYAL